MALLTLTLFLTTIYGFGYSCTRFLQTLSLETLIIRLGVGLGVFVPVGVLLNVLHIPLDWRIFLGLSLLIPLFDLFKYRKQLRITPESFQPSRHTLLLLLIFVACTTLYCWGPFTYPWLENDDSWGHAAGIKYVAIEKNLNVTAGEFHYINPYPPGYDLLLGVLHQTHPSLYWTLKFFNGFIVALGFLFFYIFTKTFVGQKDKALWATFFLAAIPCYLSHFIWAHALVVTLFFPAFYTICKARKDPRFILPGSLVVAGIFMVQPTQSIKFGILAVLLLLVVSVLQKRVEKTNLIILALGALIAQLWWAPVIHDIRTEKSQIALRTGNEISVKKGKIPKVARKLFHPAGGSATRSYTAQDYFVSPEYNLINNPTGIDMLLCILAIAGIPICCRRILKRGEEEKRIYGLTVMLWLMFTFLGMNSKTFNLPVGLYAFRFWMLFAIPVCLLAAEATDRLLCFFRKPLNRGILAFVLITGVMMTSGANKVDLNLSIWPWGVYWINQDELSTYVWLRENLKPDTKVFAFKDNLFVIGHDMRADFWTDEYKRSFEEAFAFDNAQLVQTLKQQGYDYLIIGQREVKAYGLEAVNQKIIGMEESGRFRMVHGTGNGARIYRVL